MSVTSTFRCPSCGVPLAVGAFEPGQLVLCASCRARIVLPGGPPRRRISRRAVASFVLGILSPIGMLVTAIPAVILGVLALRDIRRQSNFLYGRVFAIVGSVSGALFGLTCGAALAFMVREPLTQWMEDTSSESIVDSASQWTWLHPTDGVDPASGDADFHETFYRLDFDDSGWNTGRDGGGPEGGFGYGHAVAVDIGTPRPENRKTAYFRHRFTTSTGFDRLYIQLQRDDGVIVYLDGKEVARDNVGEGKEAYDLSAVDTVGDPRETEVQRLYIRGAIGPGEHILAISLHNRGMNDRGNSSSDLRIAGITLRGRRNDGTHNEGSRP